MGIFGFDVMSLFTWTNLLVILFGGFVGMLLGALPGIGVSITLVLLLPLTYVLDPLPAILLLLSAYQSAEYGGSISSIVLGIPGNPAAAATVLDGYELAKRHSPGKALGYSLTASTIGGIFGGLVLIFLTVPLATFALRFSDPEFFLIGIIGIMAVALLSTGSILRGLISAVLGLMIGTVGVDLFEGADRFTFGRLELMEGVDLIALLVGLFAFSEFFSMITSKPVDQVKVDPSRFKTGLKWKEVKPIMKVSMTGSVLGSIIGIFPGMGAGAASWFSYALSKKMSKKPETFGQGNPEGIAGPEAANNSTVGGALVPLLSLGIPGSASIAIIMGAFIIQGIQPGPSIFKGDTDLVYGLLYGFLLTTVAMYVLGRGITTLFSRVIAVPVSFLAPIILILCIVGIYSTNGQMFHLWFAIAVGIAAYFMRKLDYSLPALILGTILCPILEINFRRTLVISRGDYSVFLTRPYSLLLIIVIVLSIVYSVWNSLRRKKAALKTE